MGVCCVDGCEADDKEDITYFPVPVAPGLRRKWREAIKPSVKLHQDSRICSKHFHTDDYKKVRGKFRLKARVVPSVFDKKECTSSVPAADTNGALTTDDAQKQNGGGEKNGGDEQDGGENKDGDDSDEDGAAMHGGSSEAGPGTEPGTDDCMMLLENVQVDIDPTALMLAQQQDDSDDDVMETTRKEDPISLLTSSDESDVILEEPHIDTVEVSSEDEDDKPLVALVKSKDKPTKLTRMLWTDAEDLTEYYCYQSCDGGSMCLELALEGERLCKQAAIQAGTDDLRTLSAIYSHLGNAFFYLGDYNKAMQYHKRDLTLARTMNDKLGEAKASGNLGNTLKVMGKFAEAIQCCKRHLEISRQLGDKLSEGRALYNLGNVYHAQGKHLGRVGQNDPGHFPQEVRDCLMQAVSYYEENLELMRSLGDRQAMGRACGNLGNTCYLLGDFSRAIRYHTERLQIAKEFGDKPDERRANSNLGNSHIFLGQFENAAEHYKRTLALAEELGDAAVEAQACYSLGNTYTLLREYRVAEEYHARHLAAARKLQDRVGEGRACWSLGNAHAALGNHEKALYYANEHYSISKELGDVLGMATAQLSISDLRKVLGWPPETDSPPAPTPDVDNENMPVTPFNALRVRRQSMEQLSLIQGSRLEDQRSELPRPKPEERAKTVPDDDFFALLMRAQAGRMEDQRATIPLQENRQNKGGANNKK